MAVYFENNNIKFERTGVTANVANNDVARLMYYMQCVCTSINCNNDPDIQRFTNYANWARLTIRDQAALVVACGVFSPDVLNNRVFFHSDTLCGDSNNEFYTINQVRNQVVAAESIIIAGRVRVVNKIMTYKMQWIKTYYFDPMQRLLARLNAPPTITYRPTTNPPPYRPPTINPPPYRPPTINPPPYRPPTINPPPYRPPTINPPPYRPPTITQPSTGSHKRSCCCKCSSIFIAILILIGIVVGVIISLKQRGTI